MAATNLGRENVITSLYCVNKSDISDTCSTKECAEGSCLCLDEEELALLSSLTGVRFVLNLKDGTVKIEEEKMVDKVEFCQAAERNDRNVRLLNCKKVNKGILSRSLSLHMGKTRKEEWKKVIRMLPLVQYVNMQEKIISRDPICYLCLYAEEKSELLKNLLKEVQISAIDSYLKDEKLSGLMSYMEHILKRIDEIYQQTKYQDFHRRICSNIEQYERKFQNENNCLRICRDTLDVFCETMWDENQKNDSVNTLAFICEEDENQIFELTSIYRLAKEMFKLMGVEVSSEIDEFFNVNLIIEAKHSIYDEICTGVECLEGKSIGEKKEYLKKLRDLLQMVPECTSEEASKFREMCELP